MQRGDWVKAPSGKVVYLIEMVEGAGWRCSDGWVHPESSLTDVSSSEKDEAIASMARNIELIKMAQQQGLFD